MVIRQLLAEAGRAPKAGGMAKATAQGAEAAAALGSIGSHETYVGYYRAERFVSPGGQARDLAKNYAAAPLQLNDWSLEGKWTVARQSAKLNVAPGAVAYNFHARDLHLMLGSATPVRFRVTIDGEAPGTDGLRRRCPRGLPGGIRGRCGAGRGSKRLAKRQAGRLATG